MSIRLTRPKARHSSGLNVSVLEMRRQRVPDLGYQDTETAWIITHSPST